MSSLFSTLHALLAGDGNFNEWEEGKGGDQRRPICELERLLMIKVGSVEARRSPLLLTTPILPRVGRRRVGAGGSGGHFLFV